MQAASEVSRQRNPLVNVVIFYPFGVLLIVISLNFLAFGVSPFAISTPSPELILALGISAILLVINHTWIMTATELTRAKYGIYATPEEWAASGKERANVSSKGHYELERHHNTHRNTTENTIYYILLALIFSFLSPTPLAANIWLVSFTIARLGYTYSYLFGKDNLRGLFMTLSLLSLYGMASYFALSLII